MRSIGIVGCGPSGLYCLLHLLKSKRRLQVSIFERGAQAGVGTPYDPEKNDPAMLANIASIELPPIMETLVQWLSSLSDAELTALHVTRDEISERAFYPRVLIGAYYTAQLQKLIQRAEQLGHRFTVYTKHTVTDVIVHGNEAVIQVQANGGTRSERFDYAIVASGHQNREADDESEAFSHAYDQRETANWSNARIGVLGTSLSAIDVAIGTALEAGQFKRCGDELRYAAHDPEAKFSITLMSRRGLLPEADFYCPIPYEPLEIFTPAVVNAICADERSDKLDRLFDLFKQKLAAADPSFADGIGLRFLTADSFAEVYFSARMRVPAIDWAAANVIEAKENARLKKTVAWRYAILRMHELFGTAVKFFTDKDKERFDRGLKQVFMDNYAAVPPLSIERLVALAQAGRLTVSKLGKSYEMLTDKASGKTRVTVDGKTSEFDYMIDARGQPALTLQELPFPTLRLQIIANERVNGSVLTYSDEVELLKDGVDVGSSYELQDGLYNLSRVYCLSIPHLLKLHPFIQGLTSCNELAQTMAASLERAMFEDGPEQDDIGIDESVGHLDEHSLVTVLSRKLVA